MDQFTPKSSKKRKITPSAPRKATTKKVSTSSAASGAVLVKRVPRGIPTGCPREMRVKLRYHTTAVLAAPAAGLASFATYRANGPFDPEQAVGGGQPRYYDQWTAIYNQITTVSSKLSVTFANEEAASGENQFVGVAHSAVATPPGSPERQDFMEMNHVTFKLCSGGNAKTATLTWKPEQYFIGKTIYDEDIASDVTALPVRDCYFFVWTASQSGVSVANKTFNVLIEYDVIFFDQKVPNKS